MNITSLKKEIINIYIDYINNFLTEEYFAAYYGVDLEYTKKILELGRFYASKHCED